MSPTSRQRWQVFTRRRQTAKRLAYLAKMEKKREAKLGPLAPRTVVVDDWSVDEHGNMCRSMGAER